MDSDRDPLRKIPTKHAPDIKVDIGTTLKEARSKKGHTIDAVSQHTRIPRKFLDALENNRFEDFPALAYLRGFLKSYCDYLEVDFDALWRRIEAPPAPTAPEGDAAKPSESAPAAAPAPAPTPAPAPAAPKHAPRPAADQHAPAPRVLKSNGHGGRDKHGHDAGGGAGSSLWLPGLLILAGCALAGVGLYWLSARPAAAPAPAEQAAPATPAALAPIKPAAAADVVLQFRREMWISVEIDGVEKFQGRVPQGSQQSWKAQKALTLRSSDPQDLRVTLDGKPFTLGAPQADGTFRIEAP